MSFITAEHYNGQPFSKVLPIMGRRAACTRPLLDHLRQILADDGLFQDVCGDTLALRHLWFRARLPEHHLSLPGAFIPNRCETLLMDLIDAIEASDLAAQHHHALHLVDCDAVLDFIDGIAKLSARPLPYTDARDIAERPIAMMDFLADLRRIAAAYPDRQDRLNNPPAKRASCQRQIAAFLHILAQSNRRQVTFSQAADARPTRDEQHLIAALSGLQGGHTDNSRQLLVDWMDFPARRAGMEILCRLAFAIGQAGLTLKTAKV